MTVVAVLWVGGGLSVVAVVVVVLLGLGVVLKVFGDWVVVEVKAVVVSGKISFILSSISGSGNLQQVPI